MVWQESIASFREKLAGPDPVPAGVAAAAVTASLALSLLIKVLHKRGLTALAGKAKLESDRLAQAADDDVAAFHQYLANKNARDVIGVPMAAARSAVAGLDLCAEAAGLVHGHIAADIASAGELLLSAVQVMLLSVDSNLRQLHWDAPELTAERQSLEDRAQKQASRVRTYFAL